MPEVADLYVSLRAVTAPFTTALADAGAVAERAAVQIKALQTETTSLSRRLTTLSASGDKAAASLLQLTTESDSAAVGLTAAGAEARTAAASLSATATSAREAGVASEAAGAKAAGMGSALASAAKWGALGLVGLAGASIDVGLKFQTEMTKLVTAAGAPASAIDGIKNKVIDLGTQTGYTGIQIAEALYHPISAGLDLSASLQVVKNSAMEARISGASLEDTTYALSSVMKAFDLSANDATPTMARLNAIVGEGDMRFQDFNASVKNWAPTAASMGISIESMGAGLAYLTDRGNSAEVAATRLTMGLVMATTPSKKATEMLVGLGLASEDVTASSAAMQEAMRASGITQNQLAADLKKPDGLYVMLNHLKTALHDAGVSGSEADSVLSKIFGGGRSDKAIMQLIQNLDGSGGLAEKYDKIVEQAKGDAYGQAWAKTSQTLAVQLKQIGAGIENTGIKVGTVLVPYVSSAITEAEAIAKRGVKDLADLWDIYGPTVEKKLSAASSEIQAGAKQLLVPIRSGLLDLVDTSGPLLSKAFDEVERKLHDVDSAAQPVVDGLNQLYKSVKSSDGALEVLWGRLKLGAEALGGVGLGVGSLTTLLRPLGQIVGGITHAFSDLSGGMQLSILSMIALRPFRPQIQELQNTVVGYGRSAVSSFTNVRDAIAAEQARAAEAGITMGRLGASFSLIEQRVPVVQSMGESFRSTSARIEEAGGRLVGFRSTIGGLASALGTGAGAGLLGAMKGLYGFLGGPWGVAISGAMMGLDMLAKHQQQAAAAAEAHRQRVSSLASALKDSGGIITANVRATVAQTLADAKLNGSQTGLVDTMHKVGINLSQLTDAYMGQGSSIDALRTKIAATADQNISLYQSHQITYKQFLDMQLATKAAAAALGPYNGEMATAVAKAKELTEAQAGSADAARRATTPVGQLESMVKTLASSEASADDKANALHQSLKLLSGGVLDVQAAVASQNSAITELNHVWQDSLDTAKGYASALVNVDGSLNTTTENGQALFEKLTSLRDQSADAAKATYEYAKANGDLPGALKQAENAMQKSWEAAVAAGEQMGLTADQADNVAAQMGLIPSNLAITLGVTDYDQVTRSLLYVQGLADHLKQGATIKVGALTEDALAKLNEVGVKTQSLPDGTVQITVPDEQVLRKLQGIIDVQIPTKYFNVVPLYNPKAGQSQLEGHADGGVISRFAAGGTVPGYAPRRDTVLSLLSPGEGVLVPEAVRAIGGAPAINAINRSARVGAAAPLSVGRAAGSVAVAAPVGGGSGAPVIINVYVQGSVLSERELKDTVERAYLRAGAANSQTYPSYRRG